MSRAAALFGNPRLSSFQSVNTGISTAFIIASFIRAIFLRTAGELARSDLSGAPRGGNGEIERGTPAGEARADDGVEPQFGHVPGVLGDGGDDCADGDSLPWLDALESARVCDRTDGVGVPDVRVKVNVKYL